MAAYTAYVRRLTETYGCRFLDYRDALPDQCFFDVHHLNLEGSHYFMRKLTHEVLSPWLGQHQTAIARR